MYSEIKSEYEMPMPRQTAELLSLKFLAISARAWNFFAAV